MVTSVPDEAAAVLVSLASRLQPLASLASKLLTVKTGVRRATSEHRDTPTLTYPNATVRLQDKCALIWQENCITSHCFECSH